MKRRALARGYTVVELMMALAVFATGVAGIMTMQRTTITSNRTAKNVTLANGIAEAWLSQLAADASLWTTDLSSTTWLGTVDGTGLNGAWQLPAWDDARKFGAEFDGLGNPVEEDGQFCAHIRLTWLYNDGNIAGGLSGNGVIRSEVRVFWPREGTSRVEGDCTSADAATVAAVGNATGSYHFVVHAGAVRQPGGRP